MSNAAITDEPGHASQNGVLRESLSPAAIDRVLADFRVWLEAHGQAREPAVEAINFSALLGQFTALRHEVNLQTKASRTLGEQAAKLLEIAGTDDAPKPVVKAFLDLADVLAVSAKQIRKLRDTVEPLLEQLAAEPLPEPPSAVKRPGLLARLFGASSNAAWVDWVASVQSQYADHAEASAAAAATLLDLAQAAEDGYAMTLRRVERAFPDLDLEPIECIGLPFDPETMEVVEVSGEGGPGVVADELRRGYRCKGRVVRFAQVRVAR